MSEDYEDDFENCYEEDFESDDGELEVPAVQQHQHATEPADGTTKGQHLDTHVWPSLSTSLHNSPPSKGRGHGAGAALFGRSLVDVAAGPLATGSTSTAGASSSGSDACITLQPPPPPLNDTQRQHAAAALRRSKARQQTVPLHLTTQLDLLVLHPMSLLQQYSQGVGVFAGCAATACQTRQLEQDIREQDCQTDQVEQQAGGCQVPEDLYSSSSSSRTQQQQQQQQQPGAQSSRAALPTDLLLGADPALAEFIEWAVPQVLFELQRAEAEAAANSSLVSAAAGPAFGAVQTALNSSSSLPALLAGELQLAGGSSLLAGRPVVGVSGPPTPQAAATAAAAVSAAVASAVSNHLLLSCYGPVPMAAVSEHGMAGLGCLCLWDLLLLAGSSGGQGPRAGAVEADGSSVPHGVVQLLVSEGRPTCCCWGAGEAATLVFAGMEDGSICCWDLAEPEKAHRAATQQQQQQLPAGSSSSCNLPARRPSYSTDLPQLLAGVSSSSSSSSSSTASTAPTSSSSSRQTDASLPAAWTAPGAGFGLSVGGVVGLAVVPSASGPGGAAAAGSGGGPVCRLVVLGSGGCVTLYSVVLGGAGSDAAVADLGMRSGSRVWLVKVCEGLPLGKDVARPPHQKRAAALAGRDSGTKAAPDSITYTSSSSTSSSSSRRRDASAQSGAACLLVVPGATQHLLVGTDQGRVLKGAALGVTQPPHEYHSVQWWPGQPTQADTSPVPDAIGNLTTSSSSGGGSSSGSLLGAVTSLSVCPLLPDAWVAGHSCGRVALFSQKSSRPVWVWQHPTGAPVVAVRWLPQSCGVLAVFGSSSSSSSSSGSSDGCLVAFQLGAAGKQPSTFVTLRSAHSSSSSSSSSSSAADTSRVSRQGSGLLAGPCCMEVFTIAGSGCCLQTACCPSNAPSSNSSRRMLAPSSSSSSSRQGQPARVAVAVGFSDGGCSVYQLGEGWWSAPQLQKGDLAALEALLC